MRKTANWDTDIGLNFTLSEFEVNNMMVEKLANKTLMVTTTTVSFIIMNTLYLNGMALTRVVITLNFSE